MPICISNANININRIMIKSYYLNIVLYIIIRCHTPDHVEVTIMYGPGTNNNRPCRPVTKTLRALTHHYSPIDLCGCVVYVCIWFSTQQELDRFAEQNLRVLVVAVGCVGV